MSLFDILSTYGKVVRIQAWTLLWDDEAAMNRALAAQPEAQLIFINLLRKNLDNPAAVADCK